MSDTSLDLNDLLHPASAFDHPNDVVDDPDLTSREKRAILSSWASDACAVDAMPALRHAPGGKRPVSFDDIVDALNRLDPPEKYERKWRGLLRDKAKRDRDGGGNLRFLL